MKVNFNQKFKDFYGNEVEEKNGLSTIGKSLGFNLYNLPDKLIPLNAQQKFLAFSLSVKIANATEEVEISQEEADLIDGVAAVVYFPGYYGQVKQLLNS